MNTISNLRLMAQHLAVAATIAAASVFISTWAYAEQPVTAAGQTKQAPTMTDAEDPMGADTKGAGAPAAGAPAAKPDAAAPSKGATGGQAAAPSTKDVVVGAAVFGSDGKKVGEIKGVKSEPSGSIQEIHVKTGGFLGLGGKVVVIPGAKISKGGDAIQLAMTTEEVSKMPALVEKQG
jgi:sporulation protein YlmC with PRC-barrel domain